MSNKKNTTNYQFAINKPKKRKDPKEIYDRLGLHTDNELTINIFNFLLNLEQENNKEKKS